MDGSRLCTKPTVLNTVTSTPANATLATHQRSDQPIYRLKLKSVRGTSAAAGETLLITPSHPFYVPAKRDFIPVIDLKPGDLLQSLADGDTENTSSEVESLELYLPRGKTYNLTVDVGHTFYVGELQTWVHNTGPCDLPPDYFGGGAKEVAAKAATGGAEVAATTGTFPDEVSTGKKPHQKTPGTGSVTQERYNPATGKLEESVIEYDQYGRQVRRTDYTNHGYGNPENPA